MRGAVLLVLAAAATAVVLLTATAIGWYTSRPYDRTRTIRRRLPLRLRARLVRAYDRRFRRQGRRHQGAAK